MASTAEREPERRVDTALDGTLDQREIAERTDETAPLPSDERVDLGWAREDPAHAGAIEAAARGDLTPEETVEDVAASLGYRERSILDDDDDGYDH